MKYNQNEKIEQVSEKTLIVGADIAKEKHVARAQDFRGIELHRPLTFTNNRKGFNLLMNWMRTIMAEHDKDHILFAIEPTGHYWLTLSQFLREQGVKTVLVNPMHVKKSKELDDNSPTKNDVKDAKVIAQLAKDGRYSVPHIPTGVYAELREGMNFRDRLVTNIQAIKGRVDNWLDRYFPEFKTVFKDWGGKAALLTLDTFPLPEDVIDKGVDGIVNCWKQEVKRAVGKKRASQLVEAGKGSVGCKEGTIMAHQEIKSLLGQYRLMGEQLEQLMEQIEELLKQIPGSAEMMSVPGVGMVTVAGFIAEVGDLARFVHPRQIIKLAGLNLKENSSGKHKGQTRITKRGRPRLRALLFRCILPLVANNPEFKAMHEYFTTRAENPLKKKQSLIALCCKLIRVLFAIGKKQTPYDGRKLVNNSSVLSMQEAA